MAPAPRLTDRLGARLVRKGSSRAASRPTGREARKVVPGRTLWVAGDASAPTPALVRFCDEAGEPSRALYWNQSDGGSKAYGRPVGLPQLGGRDDGQYRMEVRLVSPRLLLALLRAPEDVVVVREIHLVAGFAVLSKFLVRRRKVVALIEGDYAHLGRTGTARWKVAYRRVVARGVDRFVANSSAATDYLRQTLGVPAAKISEGWWLSGLPDDLEAVGPDRDLLLQRSGPTFLTAGQLVPRKGVDLLIEAIARYQSEVGPCTLWIGGEGPERAALARQAERLGVADVVHFLGTLSHEQLKGLLQACDVFVFPTRQDLVGRVVVEALSVGVPVVVSKFSGAAGTLVRDGVNGVVVDPYDGTDLLSGLRRAAEPATRARLAEGARRSSEVLGPVAGARVVREAVQAVRGR